MSPLRSFAPFLLAATLATPMFDEIPLPSFQPKTWERIEAQVERSIVAIEEDDQAGFSYSCTGFSINPGKAYILTANHCVSMGPFTVDGVPSYIVHAAPELDMAIVVNTAQAKPALHYRKAPIHAGTPVAAIGYAYSLPQPAFKQGTISMPWTNYVAVDDQKRIEMGPWTMLDFPLIPGMSGGPIFDQDGRVVGVTLRTDNYEGVTRPLGAMMSVAGPYWK